MDSILDPWQTNRPDVYKPALTLTSVTRGGNVVREVDPTGVTIKRTFDANDRLLTETQVIGLDDALSGETDDLTTTYVYNADGDLIQTIDARGNSTRTTYGSFGEPLATTDALGNTTRNSFDSRGLLRSITDPSGIVTRLDYDDQGKHRTLLPAARSVAPARHRARRDHRRSQPTILDRGTATPLVTADQHEIRGGDEEPNGR